MKPKRLIFALLVIAGLLFYLKSKTPAAYNAFVPLTVKNAMGALYARPAPVPDMMPWSGMDTSWVTNPSQELYCRDGGQPQFGTWYIITSRTDLIPYYPLYMHPDRGEPAYLLPGTTGAYLRYEGRNGEYYMFQTTDGPSDIMSTLPITNPDGILSCVPTNSPWPPGQAVPEGEW